jgi:two-component system OmpR family response regulator
MTIKILVADADADVRHLLQARLTKAGYQVFAVATGFEATELFEDIQPEVVVCGVRLPGLDGLTLTRRLKAQPNAPLVILLTVMGRDQDIAAGFAAGADDYMIKPFSPLVLAERVRVNLIRTGRMTPAEEAESEAADE